jgi:hypothetical protein
MCQAESHKTVAVIVCGITKVPEHNIDLYSVKTNNFLLYRPENDFQQPENLSIKLLERFFSIFGILCFNNGALNAIAAILVNAGLQKLIGKPFNLGG